MQKTLNRLSLEWWLPMGKFGVFLKKELKDLLTLQSLIPLILILVGFTLLGRMVSSIEVNNAISKNTIAVQNQDNSQMTRQVISQLSQDFQIIDVPSNLDEPQALAFIAEEGANCYAILPEGFGDTILAGQELAGIRTVCEITSLAVSAMGLYDAEWVAHRAIDDATSTLLIQEGQLNNPGLVKNPIYSTNKTYLNGRSADISARAAAGTVTSQSMLLPVALFVVIVFASQMTAASMANEKSDKTFETLLSMPVSRTTVLIAKMISVGLMGIIYAVVYLIGFSFMGQGSLFGSSPVPLQKLEALGLSLGINHYVLIGADVLLSILVALSLAIIVGVLAKDVKAAQGAISPLIFVVMVPYLISVIADVNTLPIVIRTIVYLIPFSHTFAVVANIYMGNWMLIGIGILYQTVILIVMIILASRIFNSDIALTMNLDFSSRRRMKKQTRT